MKKAKKKYTIKMHAYQISLMLKRIERGERKIDGCCPAAPKSEYNGIVSWENSYHEVCMDFVDVPKKERKKRTNGQCCPCWAFGNKKALIKTTWALALYNLERKGGK